MNERDMGKLNLHETPYSGGYTVESSPKNDLSVNEKINLLFEATDPTVQSPAFDDVTINTIDKTHDHSKTMNSNQLSSINKWSNINMDKISEKDEMAERSSSLNNRYLESKTKSDNDGIELEQEEKIHTSRIDWEGFDILDYSTKPQNEQIEPSSASRSNSRLPSNMSFQRIPSKKMKGKDYIFPKLSEDIVRYNNKRKERKLKMLYYPGLQLNQQEYGNNAIPHEDPDFLFADNFGKPQSNSDI